VCYNELQFNNYYNLLTMFSIFWSITSLLAFDIRYSLSKNSKYFFTFFSGTVTEFLKTLTLIIHIYNDFTLAIQADSSFTAGGKIDLKNYDFTFIFCRPNLLSIRHIISKNEIYKLIRSNFAIFSIINCLIYSTL
jgi:hypothetical protein